MASFKLLLFFIVVSFFGFSTTEAPDSPVFLHQNCSANKATTAGSVFQSNLRTLFSSLSSNATANSGFHKATVADTVHGLFMCRGDVPSELCRRCVLNATQRLSSECFLYKEAVIWYEECMVRYSNRSFFSTVDTMPRFQELNTSSSFNPADREQTSTLANLLVEVANEAGYNDKRYVTKSSKLNALQTLYTLGQCTQDLSSADCTSCLSNVMGSAIPWPHLGKGGGRVLYPSCNVRFELFQFRRDGDEAPAPKRASPSKSRPTEKRKGRSRTTLLIVTASCVLGILFFLSGMVFSFRYCLLRGKARKNYTTILKQKFGDQSATLERLQFKLAIIKAATNNFSPENKIGRGGFGEVYKGILLDGRQIAAKRLSKTSKQGDHEFKNEILLIAKLQHKNLVAFIGFCLEEQEKILVYEYMPNRSLDYLLVDIEQRKLLSWIDRYNIIIGVARGILYLHEYSRLKVIHRDLKPSNILLDENMIPKISDFGLAKNIEINQDQGKTKRIAGTHGYMSPEYAMFGQFSEKLDIFSFGVMVLEIVSGRKNARSHESHDTYGLLNYVRRHWRDKTPLCIIDPTIKDNYSEIEVIKCLQVGLLCVEQNPNARPTMAAVVLYLSDHSIELPTLPEAASVLHRRMDPELLAQESISGQSITIAPPFSVNEMSLSNFLPR